MEFDVEAFCRLIRRAWMREDGCVSGGFVRTAASLKAVQVRSNAARRRVVRRLQRVIAVALATALILAGLSVPQWVSAVTGSVAVADATGTGGVFVPLQTRLVNNVAFAASVPQSFQALGQAQIPASNVAALVATVTVVNAGSLGLILTGANTGGSTGMSVALLFESGDTVSNSTMIEVGDDGKIKVSTDASVTVIIDVQGYFTTGNGLPAPGGFVSLPPATLGTLTPAGANQVQTVQGIGIGGIPSTATAAFVNLVVDNSASASNGSVTLYPTNAGTVPSTPLNFDAGNKTAIGTTVDLDSAGQFNLKFGSTLPSNVKIDVLGYFDGEASNAGYTPLSGRLYDSNQSPNVNLAGGATADITVNGAGGMPAYTASITGVAINIQVMGSTTAAGAMIVYPSDASLPTASTIEFPSAVSAESNTTIVRPGADGKIKVRNTGPAGSGSMRIVLDVQGYFTNTQNLPVAVGTDPERSGNRSAAQMQTRSITDRISAGFNPVNGNLMVSQTLLSLTGVGVNLGIGVRFNSLNDTRPTLNVGLFEAQLFRNSNGTVTYTAPDGGGYTFTDPVDTVENGVGVRRYAIPNGINAHLTQYAQTGQPMRYELVMHPGQSKMIWLDSGSNVLLREVQDVTGINKITYNYGPSNERLQSITDSQGRVVNLAYSASPNPTQPTTITDTSLNRSITLQYNGPSGALSKVTDATGTVTNWAYGTNGKLSSITDVGTASRTDFTYDGNLRLLTEKFGANSTTAFGLWLFNYGTAGQTAITDPRSIVSRVYHANGQASKTTDGRGLDGKTSYAVHGELSTMTAPGVNDAATSYSYDTANKTYNPLTVTSPGGSEATSTFGNPFVGKGATSDYRPTSVKDAQGNTADLVHNAWGQVTSETRGKAGGTGTAAGGTLTYLYQGDGSSTCGSPGHPGLLCRKTDAEGNITGYTYNATGNLTSVNYPAPMGDHSFTYDAAGRKITELDGRGNTAYYCWDANDRIKQKSYTSSACGTASGNTYVYNTAGNTTARTDSSGTTTFTYDAQQRVLTKDAPGGTLNDSAISYDGVGNVIALTDAGTATSVAGSFTTTYQYDEANNLVKVAEPGGSCPTGVVAPNSTKCTVITFMTNRNLVLTQQAPTGVRSDYEYDSSAKLTSLRTTNTSGTALVDRDYNWITGNAQKTVLQSVTDFLPNVYSPSASTTTPGVTNYAYDGLNQLTGAQINTGATVNAGWAWTYDKNGNRLSQNASGVFTNYGYNDADQLCWSGTGSSATCTAPSGATTYNYDGNGNMINGTYTYTTEDQFASTSASTFTYAGTTNNERLTWVQGTITNTFTNSLTNQVNAVSTGGATTKYIRNVKTGALIARQTSAGSTYYTSDYNNSVILLTDSTQAPVARYDYDPFGQIANGSGSGVGTAAAGNPWRYTSGYQTTANSFIKMGARYYLPAIGRFSQPDPSMQEQNNYTYASNNPVTYSDPTGLFGIGDVFTAASNLIGIGSLALGPVGAAIGGVVSTGLGIAGDVANGASSEEVLAGGIVDIAGAAVSGLGAAFKIGETAENIATGVDAGYTAIGTCLDYCG